MMRPAAARLLYRVYPPVLRTLELAGVHRGRQPYAIGFLAFRYSVEQFRAFLLNNGFEDAILAWRDNGEILGLRKIDKGIFQWHIRLFNDREIRGHYEYSSEGNPIAHITQKVYIPDADYFKNLLADYLSV